MLSLTVAPKDITSPPSPRFILSPLSVMDPFTVNVLAIDTSVKLPVLEDKMLAVTFCVIDKIEHLPDIGYTCKKCYSYSNV